MSSMSSLLHPRQIATRFRYSSYWAGLPPLPALDGCTDEQRRAIELADAYGVIAFRLAIPTARGSGVRLYHTLVIGDGRGHASSPEPEYRLGAERLVRVEWRRTIRCECALAKQGTLCPHAGAILRHLLTRAE